MIPAELPVTPSSSMTSLYGWRGGVIARARHVTYVSVASETPWETFLETCPETYLVVMIVVNVELAPCIVLHPSLHLDAYRYLHLVLQP